VYTPDQGRRRRHTPFFTGYQPQFYFRTTDVTGVAKLLGGAEMVMPGDNVSIEVELKAPIAMEDKLPLRHPRRWQDGRLGRGDQGHRLKSVIRSSGRTSRSPRRLFKVLSWQKKTRDGVAANAPKPAI